MATYSDLYNLNNNSDLKNRVMIACLVSAEAIVAELDTVPNHANRLIWAAKVFATPAAESDRMFWALIAANNSLTLEQITGATDAGIQTEVNNHVDLFAV